MTRDIVATERGILCSFDAVVPREEILEREQIKERQRNSSGCQPEATTSSNTECAAVVERASDSFISVSETSETPGKIHKSATCKRTEDKVVPNGPGPVTMATYYLICKLVEKGTIDKREVLDILKIVSNKKDLLFETNTTNSSVNVNMASKESADLVSNLDADLSSSVLERLEMFGSRIRAAGKATLVPSRAVMGPPFAPALDFLRGVVRDAVIRDPEPSATAAEVAVAEHPIDRSTESRKRSREDNK